MTFLDPLAGLAGVAAVAIVALYFLKTRRPAHQVSSTLWWRPLTLDRQAAVPWQRLKPSSLLVLQLLAAALLVAALMEPALASAKALTGQTIVIIDTSETMAATDVAPSRLAQAVSQARALVGRLGPRARMTLIDMDADPTVLALSDGDRQDLLHALGQLRTTDGPADLQGALQLALAAAGPHATRTHLVLLSDGITEPLAEPARVPFPLEYSRVGESDQNVGITSLSVVRGPAGVLAEAHVEDFGAEAADLTMIMAADGRLSDAKAVALPPRAGREVAFPVPAGATYVRVTLLPGDDLAADGSAVGVTGPRPKIRMLLVTNGDLFLEQALLLRGNVQLTTEATSAWDGRQASSNGFDLLVFDGFVPPELPASTPYLVVGPPADRHLGSGPPVVPGPLVPAEGNDPLLYDVDLSSVDVAMSADLAGSNFGRVAISSRAGPVLMVRAGSPQGPPAAVLGVYLQESDIVLRSAFPILITHLSEYLAPGLVPSGSQAPGSPVTFSPGPGTSEVVVTRPDGRTYTVRARGLADAGGIITFTGTDEAGLYQVTSLGPGQARHDGYLAVNSPGTPIAPRRALPVVGSVAKGQLRSVLYEDLWPWAAFAGLLVLMVEWLESHRAR